jgi:subtilisin family serine protease
MPRIAKTLGWTLALLACWSGRTYGQVLPGPVPLPPLPTGELARGVEGVLRNAPSEALREVRRLRVRELLRVNRQVLETDPRGAPIIRSEVVALSPTPAALEQARAQGFTVGRTRTLEGLDVSIVVLQAPTGMSTRRALRVLRNRDPEGTYDFNHVYTESGEIATTPVGVSAPGPAGPMPATNVRVGLIDGGVARDHSVFRDVAVHEHGCAGGSVPSAHGTAVASLIAGRAAEFSGAAPGAQLYVADVYCGLPSGGALDAIADAFAWLSRERVPVINVSLVGPHNILLEQIVKLVSARGHLVVAAVGNDGPSAPPLYPAAYPQAIGVTGVDAKRRALVEACRGKHVDFAAPGANMSAAGVSPAFQLVRGTSFAAPIVAGLLAQELATVNPDRAAAIVAALAHRTTDLGVRGRDKIYGDGLVGETVRPSEQLAGVDAAKTSESRKRPQ